jgi:hypothetical protein
VIHEVRYDASVEEYLLTNPHAGEVRLLVASIVRGQVPLDAIVGLDDRGLSMFQLEQSNRFLWWHYEGPGDEILVLDGIE